MHVYMQAKWGFEVLVAFGFYETQGAWVLPKNAGMDKVSHIKHTHACTHKERVCYQRMLEWIRYVTSNTRIPKMLMWVR
jgi:hypothetical protein